MVLGSKNASSFVSNPLLLMEREYKGLNVYGDDTGIIGDENKTDKSSFPRNSLKNTSSLPSRHAETYNNSIKNDGNCTSSECLEKGSEQLNLGVLESKSSVSQSFVIRKWATKYDTEEKDNYESDDDEDVVDESVCVERRNDIEAARQEGKYTKKYVTTLDERQKTSTWNCGVARFDIDKKEYEGRNSASIHYEGDNEIAATRRKSKETKDFIWACEASKFLATAGNSNATTKETQENQDIYELPDSGNDDDSSAAWFLNTFHPSDQLVSTKTSNRKLTIIGSHSLSTSSNYRKDNLSTRPHNQVKETISAHQDAMAAELDPLVFELDSLSAREDAEEEVVFHEGYDEEINMSTFSTNRNESERDEMLSTVTDAITALCLTPRDQQQMLEEQVKVTGDRFKILTTDSTSIGDPNIELELRCSANENEVDEIIVVDAVVRALRRSKTKISDKNSNQEKDLDEEDRTKNTGNQIRSDAMDVLMSLTLMECGESINRSISNELPVENTFSISNCLDISVDKDAHKGEAMEAMDILAMLHADDNTSSFHSSDGDTEEKSSSSSSCRNKNAVDGLDYVEHEEADDVTKCRQRTNVNENNGRMDEFQPLEENKLNISNSERTMSLESKRKRRNDSVEISVQEENTLTVQENSNPGLSVVRRKSCDETNRDTIFEPKIKESDGLEKDFMVLEELDLEMDSDSFSIDGFCDNSLSEDNPIRARPCVTVKKIETKNSTKKAVDLQPPRCAFKNISPAMSNSFELISSLSSSDDCRIPTPPQLKKERVCINQKQGKEILDFYSPSKRFSLLLDPTNTPHLSVQKGGIPTSSKKPIPQLPSSPLATSNEKRTKKKKHRRRIQKLSTTATTYDHHLRSSQKAGENEIAPVTTTLGDKNRQAMNNMVQNGNKEPAVETKRQLKCTKSIVLQSVATEDGLRSGRKISSLASTSNSVKRFDESIDSKEEDLENRSPNPGTAEQSINSISFPKKGILRVKFEGAQKLISNPNRSSVHWDEKQLANKVKKGVMVGVSSRKCRPIRVLKKHMLEITAVQDGYGNELESLLGLRSTSKGYIC